MRQRFAYLAARLPVARRLAARLRPWPSLAALLGLLLLLEMLPNDGGVAPAPALIASGTAVTVADPSIWQQTILARPLFNASRRPAGNASAPDILPRLSAILIGPNGASAIFANGQKALVVAAGGAVAGDRVQSIDAAGVVLITAAGPVTLHPRYASGTAAPAATAPPSSIPAQPADSALTAGPYDNE